MVFLKLKGILEIFPVSVQRWFYPHSIYIISDTETVRMENMSSLSQRSDYKDVSHVTYGDVWVITQRSKFSYFKLWKVYRPTNHLLSLPPSQPFGKCLI